MRRLLTIPALILLCLLLSLTAEAKNKFTTYATQGGAITTQGVSSKTKALRVFPGATVTVYALGTLTTVSLWSDDGVTVKANPFTADATTGAITFWANDATVDVRISGSSGGTSITPFTFTLATVSVIGGPESKFVATLDSRVPSVTGDRICYVSQMSGADVGARINACDALLGADKGEIVLTGGGNIATQVVISSYHTLRVVSGTYTATLNNAVIRLKNNSSLVCDSWSPILQESSGSFLNTSPMTIVTAWSGSGPEAGAPNGNKSENITVRGCHLQGKADIPTIVSIGAGTNTVTATTSVFNSNQVVAASRYQILIPGAGAAGGAFAAELITTPTGFTATLGEAALTTVTNVAAIIKSTNSVYPALYLGNCHNCTISKNWLDRTHSIGIQAGGGSALGFYAKGNVIENNLLTDVASQVLAVSNAEDVTMRNNDIYRAGQDGGPGVSVIDVEPNVGDRTRNILIDGNLIDVTESILDSEVNTQKVSHGIVIQNGNGAAPFDEIVVSNNKVIGTRLSQTGFHRIAGAGIIVREAAGVKVHGNYVQRAYNCVLLDSGSTSVSVTNNECNSTGSGSTAAIGMIDSSNNKVLGNNLYADINDAFGTGANALSVSEAGTSTGNVIDANAGARVSRNDGGGVITVRPASTCSAGVVCDTSGAGSPEGVVPAAVGSTYRRTDGAAGTIIYTKDSSPTPTTGWNPQPAFRSVLSVTASLNFTALAAHTCETLTTTLTGVADDGAWTVTAGIPNALIDVDGATESTTFVSWVSGANVVSLRRCNATATVTADPAAASVKFTAIKQ